MTSHYRFLGLALGLSLALPVAVNAAETSRQPAPYPDSMHTWYGSYYNTTSQHDDVLKVGGYGDFYHSQIRFDLSGLPLTATQAIIYLFPQDWEGEQTNINFYRNNANWQTSTVAWSNAPVSTWAGLGDAPGPGWWYGIDITGIYNQWRSGTPGQQNYGLKLTPTNNDDTWSSFLGSSYSQAWQRPQIHVTYNPSGTDSLPKFKWPLQTPSYANRTENHPFGANPWAGLVRCPLNTGPYKIHNGTDFHATPGTFVYAIDDGVVKAIAGSQTWGFGVVTEHTRPNGSKYTVVYWHIVPHQGIALNSFIPKGEPVGTIYEWASPHLHIGMRNASYASHPADALSGASPAINCDSWSAFPANFVNVNSTANVVFH